MKRLVTVLAAIAVLFYFVAISSAQNSEEITLTTYYPAPYGEYDSLSVGSGYAAPATDGRLVVQESIGIGTTNVPSRLVIAGDAVNKDRIVIGTTTPMRIGEFRADFNNSRVIESAGGLGLRAAASGDYHMYIAPSGSVGIGRLTTLDVSKIKSSSCGLLLPRSNNPAGITSPVNGMVVYNSSANRLEFFNGSTWLPVGGGLSSSNVATGQYTGNNVSGRPIDVGFLPKVVVVMKRQGDNDPIVVRTADMDNGSCQKFNGGEMNDGILSFYDQGFRVGTSRATNRTGITYYWYAYQ